MCVLRILERVAFFEKKTRKIVNLVPLVKKELIISIHHFPKTVHYWRTFPLFHILQKSELPKDDKTF